MIRTAVASSLAIAIVLFGAVALAGRPGEAPATAADADAFVAHAEKDLNQASIEANQIAWVNATYITDDTVALAASSGDKLTSLAVKFAGEAAKYQAVPALPFDTRRKLNLMRTGVNLPVPTRPGAADQLAAIATRLNSNYDRGKAALDGKPINGTDIEAAMGTVRDPEKLKAMWTSWNDTVGPPAKPDYAKMVALSNQGASELGYADLGALWRSAYDMKPEEFSAMTDKLYKQVEPLYLALHCYVRWKLNAKYGDTVQSKTGPIRADLLGTMGAQDWGNIYDIVAPKGAGDIRYDIGALLKTKGYSSLAMVKAGEGFYSSLGFAPLPATFWTRSQFTKPEDRTVVCHASAWDIDNKDDVRVKMCIKVNARDFVTIHDELGHNYYQRAYMNQAYLYKGGANDAFSAAVGDFLALSVTPDYFVTIGLLDASKVPGTDKDIGVLLRQAMDKVALLPFGLLVDEWRWGVFRGSIKPARYQAAWDALRLRYQGVQPPVERDNTRFDAGATYLVPANTPSVRYFLAAVLQFQLCQAACKQAGWSGPLHRCSFYGNRAVGARLQRLFQMGRSRPWPAALEQFTGSREISAQALVDYFAPLKDWLDGQNRGKPQGW